MDKVLEYKVGQLLEQFRCPEHDVKPSFGECRGNLYRIFCSEPACDKQILTYTPLKFLADGGGNVVYIDYQKGDPNLYGSIPATHVSLRNEDLQVSDDNCPFLQVE